MPKNITPEMEAINRQLAKRRYTGQASPFREACRRLVRNRTAIIGIVIVALMMLVALLAPFIAPYGYEEMDLANALQGPSLRHLFGTDDAGRDLFSRCLYGARITLPIAFFSTMVAVLVGGVVGVVSAYFGGSVDTIIMRVIDIWGSIPGMMLSVAVVACFGNNIIVLVIGLSVGAIPNMARMFRGSIFTVVDNDYVESSRSIGASNNRIMFLHLLPNSVGPVILAIVNLLNSQVLGVSTLSFIGVGVNPPTPEWGALLSAGKSFLSIYPHLCAFPGLCIVLCVLGFNLLGDGLRDALDPRLK